MKRAHEAEAYNEWFRAQVQTSIDDPRPNVSAEPARTEFAARREALRAHATGAKTAKPTKAAASRTKAS